MAALMGLSLCRGETSVGRVAEPAAAGASIKSAISFAHDYVARMEAAYATGGETARGETRP